MLRRECIDKVGNFDEKLKIFEDIDLWIRIAQHYKVEFINRILAVHRRHGKNTAYDRMGIHLNSISYLENLIDKYPSFVKINELQDKIARHAYFAGREYMRKGEYPAAKTFLNKSLKFQRVSLLGNSAIYPKSLVAYLISMIKCRHWRYK
jgi:tetratricopeptide (TPR) repeat protein